MDCKITRKIGHRAIKQSRYQTFMTCLKMPVQQGRSNSPYAIAAFEAHAPCEMSGSPAATFLLLSPPHTLRSLANPATPLKLARMLKAIVFDFDGVVVDSEPAHYKAFLHVAKPLGLNFSYETYLQEYVGFDDRDAFAHMLSKLNLPPDGKQIAKLIADKADAFEAIVHQGMDTIPGVLDLIKEAVAADFPIAIASGATRRDIDVILEGLKLDAGFNPIITADLVKHSKPDPTSYAMAVQGLAERLPELDLTPAECLSIEDTAAGLASATGAGLMALGLTTTGPAAALSQARRVIPNLEGVTLDTLRQWFAN